LRLQSFILEARAGDSLHVLDRVDPNVSSPVGEGEPGGVIAFQYAEKEIPVRVDTVAVSGELRGNLFDSFLAMGEQPVLVDEMIRIFAWDIDFFRDPRTGDVFQVLMEKRFAPAGRFLGYGEVLAARYENAGRAFDAVRYQGRYFASDGRSLEKQLMKAPLRFSSISSGFSHARLHPILGVKRPHWGVDYVAPAGTPIFAAGDGMVVYAKWCGGYGRTVKIRHNVVYNTYYGHLQGYADAIAAGTRVSQGQVIAYLGMSGLATGPHLDYRVERNGAYVNPRTLVSEALAGVPASDFPAFGAQRDRMLARMGGSVSTRLARRSAGNVSKSKGEGS
jgi:murein DD-endopeptidase MepM/ murein hydrolase activator NlpD